MARYKMKPTTPRWDFMNNLMAQRNLNQTQLGAIIGLRQEKVCSMLRFSSKPNYLLLITLSEYFNVTIDELVKSYANENPKWQLE